MQRMNGLITAGIFAAGCFIAQTSASVSYPGPFVGSDVTYSAVSEASADPVNDPEPLFGNPSDPTNPEIVAPNTLDFDPASGAFAASAPPPDTTDGSLSFLVESNDGSNLDQVTFTEGGDFGFAGSSPNGEFVGATLNVTFQDADDETVLGNVSRTFFKQYSSSPIEASSWTINLSAPVSQYQTDAIQVVLNNRLVASSTSGNTAFIRKKQFQIGSSVPEPASLALMGIGALAFMRRPKCRTI